MQDAWVVWIGKVGDVDNPANWDRIGNEDELVRCLRKFGVRDTLFSGASGNVQYYDARSQTLCVATERPKTEDKRWVLLEGQTERGLALIVKLARASFS